MKIISRIALFGLAVVSSAAFAGTLTVTSPNDGDFLGRTNTVKFQLRQAVVKAKVTATASRDANPNETIVVTQDFEPDTDGNVNGSLNLNFNPATPEGDYTITVTVTEPGNSYNQEVRHVVVDTVLPKFLEFNPINNAFVKGVVPIRVKLEEPNLKEWRVQVNSQDIPNNSGDLETFEVDWDSNSVQFDGQQTIGITVKDKANNEASQNITITLDRVAPVSSILAPNPGTEIRPRSNIPVVVNFADQFTGSINVSGISIELQDLDGHLIGLVARRSAAASGTTLNWTGRIRWKTNLPETFKMVVKCRDRAGNVGVNQVITIRNPGRGR